MDFPIKLNPLHTKLIHKITKQLANIHPNLFRSQKSFF